MFGCELVHLSEREHSLVPKFMTHFIEHIERKGLETVGLYRLSGNAAQVQKLRYLVEDSNCYYLFHIKFLLFLVLFPFSFFSQILMSISIPPSGRMSTS